MSEVKGQYHIVYPVSNRSTSFTFHTIRTHPSENMAKRVIDLENTHPAFSKKTQIANKLQKNFFNI